MMRIKTRLLGEVDIRKEEVITFPEGILGFPESHEFVLLEVPGNSMFKVLQDVKEEFVSFILTDPFLVYPNYEINIPDEDLKKIDILIKEQLGALSMVTLAEPFEKSTMNLLAPIILNVEKRLGRQYVLTDPSLKTKHPLSGHKGGE